MCSNCDCGSKKGQVKESSFQVNQVNGQLIEMDDRSPGRPSRNSKTLCLMWTWGTTKKKNEVNLKKKNLRDWKEVNLENKERKKMRGTAVMMADVALILLGITSRCYFFQPQKIFICWILSHSYFFAPRCSSIQSTPRVIQWILSTHLPSLFCFLLWSSNCICQLKWLSQPIISK